MDKNLEKCEPVGVVKSMNEDNDVWLSKLPIGTELYTSPQPIEKCDPVARIGIDSCGGEPVIDIFCNIPDGINLLYTSPISKEWVGISEERLLRLILAYRNVDDLLKVVTAELKQLNVPEKG